MTKIPYPDNDTYSDRAGFNSMNSWSTRVIDGQTPNDEKYCCKECDLCHNDINDRAEYETIDFFLLSHDLYHHIAPP